MNLSFILDVALGLIFIYLILSLLASEIQELIATVFQWRAEHLRKSIEIFLAGDLENSESPSVIRLSNSIYSNPLLKNINQQAKGFLVTLPRKATWAIGKFYRSVITPRSTNTKSETTFGLSKHSGPSYIPADIFATTLLETLQLPVLVHKLTESRLVKFKDERLGEIQEILDKLQQQTNVDENFVKFINNAKEEFKETQAEFEDIILNFKQGKANMISCIIRMGESIERYIETFATQDYDNPLHNKAVRQIKFLRKDVFEDTERAITLGGLRPNIYEVVQSVNRGSAIYQELEEAFHDKESAAYQNMKSMIDELPPSVVENLAVLAKRAQGRIQKTQSGIHALREELNYAFDSSMERASGVYKRNAKGVAILIGFTLAVISNADAFHMASRLSKDSALRETIVYNSGAILMQNPDKSAVDIQTLRNQANQVLNDVSLPLGWTDVNLNQQIGSSTQSQDIIPGFRFISIIAGWFVSGIAIAMGAPFWFDLLGKIVNVRNAGKPPASSAQNREEN
jgi:hypothetical protein